MEYEVDQKALLNVNNFTLLKDLTLNFMPKFAYLSSIMEQVFKVVYKLEFTSGDQSASDIPCFIVITI